MKKNIFIFIILPLLLSCSTTQQLLTGTGKKIWNKLTLNSRHEIDWVFNANDTTLEKYFDGMRDTYGCIGIGSKPHYKIEGKKIYRYLVHKNISTTLPTDTLLLLHLSKKNMILTDIQGNGISYFTNGVKRNTFLSTDFPLETCPYQDMFARLLKAIHFDINKCDSLIVEGIYEKKRTIERKFPIIYNFSDADHYGKYTGKNGYSLEWKLIDNELWGWVARGPIYIGRWHLTQISTQDGWLYIYKKDGKKGWKFKKCKRYKF